MENTYNLIPGFRSSALKKFSDHPSLYYKEYIEGIKPESTPSSKMGVVIHSLITSGYDPLTAIDVRVYKNSVPTGQMLTFCDFLVHAMKVIPYYGITDILTDTPEDLHKLISRELYQQAYLHTDIKRDTLDKFIERFKVEGNNYVAERLLEALSGDTIIFLTENEYATCIVAASILSGYLEEEFDIETLYGSDFEADPISIVVEKEISYVWEGYSLKTKPDIIAIDPNSMIVRVIDIKTKSVPIEKFPFEFVSNKLYIQAVTQFLGVEEWMKTEEFITKYGEGYTLKYPEYLVYAIPTSDVVLFQTTERDIAFAKYGGKTPSGYRIKGVLTLLEELKWHIETNLWKREKSFYVADGGILLDAFSNYTLATESDINATI